LEYLLLFYSRVHPPTTKTTWWSWRSPSPGQLPLGQMQRCSATMPPTTTPVDPGTAASGAAAAFPAATRTTAAARVSQVSTRRSRATCVEFLELGIGILCIEISNETARGFTIL